MTALTQDRTATVNKSFYLRELGAAAGKEFFMGAIAVKDSAGRCRPGYTATGLKAIGAVREYVDNSAGADDDVTVVVEAGVYAWENSAAGDQITIADIGNTAYIVDDQTVAKTDAAGTRSACGEIFDLADGLVWVKTGL